MNDTGQLINEGLISDLIVADKHLDQRFNNNTVSVTVTDVHAHTVKNVDFTADKRAGWLVNDA